MGQDGGQYPVRDELPPSRPSMLPRRAILWGGQWDGQVLGPSPDIGDPFVCCTPRDAQVGVPAPLVRYALTGEVRDDGLLVYRFDGLTV